MVDSVRTVSSSFAVVPELQRPDRVYRSSYQGSHLNQVNPEDTVSVQHYPAGTDLRGGPSTFEHARRLEEGRHTYFEPSAYMSSYMMSSHWYITFKGRLLHPKVMYAVGAIAIAVVLVTATVTAKK